MSADSIDLDKVVFCKDCEHFQVQIWVERKEDGTAAQKTESFCSANVMYELTPERPIPLVFEGTEKNKDNNCPVYKPIAEKIKFLSTVYDQEKQ